MLLEVEKLVKMSVEIGEPREIFFSLKDDFLPLGLICI